MRSMLKGGIPLRFSLEIPKDSGHGGKHPEGFLRNFGHDDRKP